MMAKRLIAALVVFVMLLVSVPAFAECELDVLNQAAGAVSGSSFIEETLTVTSEREVFQVGFATLRFPREFIDSEQLPVTVKVSIYFEDGQAWIEFSEDLGEFDHKVQVRVKGYDGLLYDVGTGQDVYVSIRSQVMMLTHFSRYAFS